MSEPLDLLVYHNVPLGGEPELADDLRGCAARGPSPPTGSSVTWSAGSGRAWSSTGTGTIWAGMTVEGLAADIQADAGSWGVLRLDGDGRHEFVRGEQVASKAEAPA